MRRGIVTAAVFALTCLAAWQPFTPAAADSPTVLVMNVEGPIKQLTADYIARGMDTAHRDDVELVVIRLNTPGGLFESTRKIVQKLLDSEVPVAVYVLPRRSPRRIRGDLHCGRGQLRGHGAGCQHRRGLAGRSRRPQNSGIPGAQDQPRHARVHPQHRRGARTQCGRFGRHLIWKGTAYSAHEALRLGVIDLIAPDLPTALNQLHGRQTTTAAGPITVASRDARVRNLGPTAVEHILGILTRPEVVFVLFVTACLALLVEVLFPGLIIPSLTGVVTLALAIVGFLNLHGSWLGVVLIVLAAALFYGETTVPGFGLFGAGGILCLVLGGILSVRGLFPPLGSAGTKLHGEPGRDRGDGRESYWRSGRYSLASHSPGAGKRAAFRPRPMRRWWGGRASRYPTCGRREECGSAHKDWVATTGDPGVSIDQGEDIRVRAVYGRVLRVRKTLRAQAGYLETHRGAASVGGPSRSNGTRARLSPCRESGDCLRRTRVTAKSGGRTGERRNAAATTDHLDLAA